MKNTFFIIVTFVGSLMFAQNESKAKSLLNEVSNKIQNYDNISVDFKINISRATAGMLVNLAELILAADETSRNDS